MLLNLGGAVSRCSLLFAFSISLLCVSCTNTYEIDDCSRATFPGMWSGHLYINSSLVGYASVNARVQLDVEPDGESIVGWLYYVEGTYEVSSGLIPFLPPNLQACEPIPLMGTLENRPDGGIYIPCLHAVGYPDMCFEFSAREYGPAEIYKSFGIFGGDITIPMQGYDPIEPFNSFECL